MNKNKEYLKAKIDELETNSKTKNIRDFYMGMDMSQNQNAGQSHNIKLDNKFFERVEQFKY